MTPMTITLDNNTFIVAVYEFGKLVRFELPRHERDFYPHKYEGNSNFSNVSVPTEEILMRAGKARILGFQGFKL